MSNPVFEFDLRLTAQDPSGYYYPRWDLACDIAAEYFGHGNVEVTIMSAELRGTHTLDGEFQSATFEADFTAEEVTP